jgi:pilus assembly protein CpaE
MSAPSGNRNFGQWKILLISPDGGVGEQLAPLLAEFLPFSPVIELKDYPTRSVLTEALEDQGCNLCFLDAESSRDWAQALLTDLAGMETRLPVVSIHSVNDPDYILRALRQGGTEFLVRPFSADTFLPVMERIASMFRGGHANCAKMCLVAPVKGACGATTLASNLALHWKRHGGKRVLLADLDPLAGTVSFQLKLKQSYSFMDALSRGSQLDEDIWKGMVNTVGGIDVILAPEQPVHGIDEAHNAARILDFARGLYDVVVVDCGSVYGQWNLSLAKLCDDLLLVTTNELPALQASQRALAHLERQKVERSKIRVVVNRYAKDIGLTSDVIEAALHTDVYHIIPSEYEDVQRALVEGKLLQSSTPVGKAISDLVEKLAGKKARAPQPKSGSLANLFSFLRK